MLYIRNLALSTAEEGIRNMCESIAGGVERVKKQKDYAFVHFSSREKAECVKDALNGELFFVCLCVCVCGYGLFSVSSLYSTFLIISGRILDGCELEVNWAKPIKNREEYQQKKALGRHMYSVVNSSQPGYLPHLSLAG